MRKTASLTMAAAVLLIPYAAHAQVGLPGTPVLPGISLPGTPSLPNTGSLTGGLGGVVGGLGGSVGGAVGGLGGAVGGLGGAVGGLGGAVGGAVGGVGGAVGGATAGSLGGTASGALGTPGVGSAAGPTTTGSVSAAAVGTIDAGMAIPAIGLPSALAPCGDPRRRRDTPRISPCGPLYTALFSEIGRLSGTREDLERFRSPLVPRRGTPQQVVQNCRRAIVAAALPYGVVRVDAASAGPMQPTRGGFAAPLEFRIVYNRRGGLEVRQATINCRMNTAGRVVNAA